MKRLIWKREPQPGDDYSIAVTNPEDSDLATLKSLFARVKSAKGGRGRYLSNQAVKALEGWLTDPAKPLPSYAYALLSNWFLTEAAVDRNSPLADRCREFWVALFAVRPAKRLTPIDKNDQIIDITFDVWWKLQTAAQGVK